jgi:hypothetical protein
MNIKQLAQFRKQIAYSLKTFRICQQIRINDRLAHECRSAVASLEKEKKSESIVCLNV